MNRLHTRLWAVAIMVGLFFALCVVPAFANPQDTSSTDQSTTTKKKKKSKKECCRSRSAGCCDHLRIRHHHREEVQEDQEVRDECGQLDGGRQRYFGHDR